MSTHRVALISDIHANAVALRAVLDDITANGVDEIVCLGDVFTLGPAPEEVGALLRERCKTFILGNHDEYLFDPESIHAHTDAPPIIGAVAQCRDQLGATDIDFAKRFERKRELQLDATHRLLLFHGSPDSNNCDLLAETPETQLAVNLGLNRAAVMAGGHTHVQMLRQHRGTLVVNPGSVGLPFERFVFGGPPTVMAHAEYAIVEARGAAISVSLCRVALDRAALADAAAAWDSPLAARRAISPVTWRLLPLRELRCDHGKNPQHDTGDDANDRPGHRHHEAR